MRFILTLILLAIVTHSVSSQERYISRHGYVAFFSTTPVEDIKAENNQVLSIADLSTGDIAITILMKSFAFEKALMQEHFNENYVESDKYPKATFKGKIINLKDVLDGDVSIAQIEGFLTIKDVTKPVIIESKFNMEEDIITFQGKFMVTVADYNIKIPAIVRRNIAREVEVTFRLIHQPYN